MPAATEGLDRRQRRRLETIDEVLDTALDIMGEQGVAGLSVGEVARRMGIRPPSLYVYFPSKHALYDALFARGATLVLEAMREVGSPPGPAGDSLEDVLHRWGEAFVRWCLEHPAYSQLLFWRPVPGYSPSPDAYRPAVELVELATARLAELQARGIVRADASVEDVQRDWTILIAGVVSQQLSNEPGQGFTGGSFTAALPRLVAMFAHHYGAPSSSAPTRRARRADQR